MKYIITNAYKSFPWILSMVVLFSCSKMDDSYKEFISNGERVYPGKVFEVEVMPGKNRVKLAMKIFPDPNVKNVWVKWLSQGKLDSLKTDMSKGTQYNHAELLVNGLEENVYTFFITTTDEDGNRSVPTEINARVYGERYQNSIRSVFIQEASYEDGILNVSMSAPSDTVAIGTEFYYTNIEDVSSTLFIPAENTSYVLEDYKLGSELTYRSMYVPQGNAIDTFYSNLNEVSVKADVTELYLSNTGFPFTNTGTLDANRWGTLSDWVTNDAAKTHNGYGGWESSGGGMMNLESGWGSPKIRNGKIYQTVTLPAGTYSFEVAENDWMGNMDVAYLVAAEGEILPDVEMVPTESLAYSNLNSLKVDFSLAEEKEVSLGIVVDFFNDQGQGFKIKKIKLSKN